MRQINNDKTNQSALSQEEARGTTTSRGKWLQRLAVAAAGLMLALPTQAQWVAFHDIFNGPLTHANTTTYGSVAGGASIEGSGALKNILTGDNLPVILTISNVTVVPAGTMATPNANTPAATIFGSYVDWSTASGGNNAVYIDSATDIIYFSFSGLNPAARYTFEGTAVRGNTAYGNRWTRVALEGADSYTAAHLLGPSSPGIVDAAFAGSGLGPNEVAFNSGNNLVGDVVGWTDINPGADGVITFACRFYGGPNPLGLTPDSASKCYAFNAMRLEELMSGPIVITQEPTNVVVEAFKPWTLSVVTTGGAPRYQWYTGDLGDGTPLEGETRRTLSKTSASLADTGNYYVHIANDINNVTSTLASVTVFVNPIVITQQPTNQLTALQNRPFTLSVENTGTQPHYQWYKDGQPLLNQTNKTYSVASAAAADAGDYRVTVLNITSGQTSTVARVTFSDDFVPPQIVRVVSSGNNDRITIEFNEAISTDPQLPPSITCSELYIPNAPVFTNANTLVCFTADPQVPGQTYTLEVIAFDLAGNMLIDSSVPYTAWVPNLNAGVVFDVYATGTGTAVSNLTSSPLFPDSPTLSMTMTNFDTTSVWPDVASPPPGIPGNADATRQNYGGRLRGFFIPPVSGDWRFFIHSDDGGELWISTNGPSADGKQKIAYEPACCNAFREPGVGVTQTSAAFPMVAGQPYYLEALYKEQGGGDFCRIGARRDGDPTPSTNVPPIMAVGFPFVPPGNYGQMLAVQEPANVTVEAPGSAQLTFVATNTMNTPFSYQWQESDGVGGFTNIPGAMIKTLSSAALTTVGSVQYRCLASGVSQVVTSQVATVTVTPDVTGPAMLSAVGSLNRTNLLITFSEPVTGIVPGNFQVCDVLNAANCLTVFTAVGANGDTQVRLETDLPTAGVVYQVTTTGVTDANGNPVQAPNRAQVQVQVMIQQGTNGPATFATLPTMDQGWSTIVIAGGAGDVTTAAAMDSAVAGVTASSAVALTSDTASPPAARNAGGYSPSGYLFTRPTGVKGACLMASLYNVAGTVRNLGIAFDQAEQAPLAQEVRSFRVYYSHTGESNSWTFLPSLSGTNGARSFDLSLPTAWAKGTSLYVLWVADNAAASPDSLFSLDNVTFIADTNVRPIQIVGQPATQTVNEGASVSFSVGVTGSEPGYQWYKDGVAIVGAHAATLSLSGVVETDSGRYHCVVSNSAPSTATSADAILTVTPDTIKPWVVSVLGTTNASVIEVVFSEKMDPASLGLTDFVVTPAAGGASLTVQGVNLATNGTTVVLLTAPRNPFAQYKIVVQDVSDAAYRRNVLTPNPTTVYFASQISLLEAVSQWRYFESGPAPANWMEASFDDSGWSNGLALFVGKSGTPGNGDIPIGTTNTIGTNTYYYRGSFPMPSQAELAGVSSYLLQVRPILDDGGVFYINGQEAARVGMTNAGPIDFNTFAIRGQGNDYRFEGPYQLPTTHVAFGGLNVMAVEVHQNSATSSDIAFAAEVLVTVLPATPIELKSGVAAGGGTFALSWPVVPGLVLYQADKVNGPYTLVPGNPQGFYSVPTTGAGKFYQVRSQ